MTKVLIVEDQRMAQENMESIIKSSENYTLAGTISNSADAELFCMREPVDLILMDPWTKSRAQAEKLIDDIFALPCNADMKEYYK